MRLPLRAILAALASVALCAPFAAAVAQTSDSQCRAVDYQHLLEFDGSRLDTSAVDKLEGKRIARIRYQRIGVFDESDPDENNSLYRFLNSLHINTKEYVVASQLLFEQGERLDPDLIHETERLLRRRDYFTTAFIVPERVCPDSVDLVVITRDSWSLEIDGSFSLAGGDSSTGIGLSDDNILGTGNSLSIGYERDEQRTGVRYSFRTDHLLNTRVATRLSYADNSDGENIIAEVERPFYSRYVEWAGGGRYRDVNEARIIRSKGDQVNEFQHERLYQEVFVGRALKVTEGATHRLIGGFTDEQDRYRPNESTTALGVPENREASYPWLEYQYLQDRYAVFRNLNQIQRTEDVPLGITTSFRLGYGEAGPARHGDVLRYIGRYQHIYDIDNRDLLSVNLSVDGREHMDSDDRDSAVFSSQVSYNLMRDANNRWYASFAFDLGQDLAQHEQLTLGGIVGMRGYPTSFQRGEKRFLATLERRYYSDWHWFNLVHVGAVAFAEAGRAWDNQAGTDDHNVIADVGVGLRMSSSKVRVGNVLHLDIATPLVDNEGIDDYQVILKAQQRF